MKLSEIRDSSEKQYKEVRKLIQDMHEKLTKKWFLKNNLIEILELKN